MSTVDDGIYFHGCNILIGHDPDPFNGFNRFYGREFMGNKIEIHFGNTTAYVIALMLSFVLILPDWFRNKFNKPINRIKTVEDIFPHQKEDIPAENFQFMQRVFTSFLIAHGVNDTCEIDESIEPSSSELYSDDEFDLLGIIDIISLVKDYSELVPQPKLEEFVLLFIKSYYDEVKGYYTFRFSDSFSS